MGFFGLSTHHITHYHHQWVLMTRWWVHLASPPPDNPPPPSPLTTTLTMLPTTIMVPPMSLYNSLVGFFGLSTHITHHHHQWVLMTCWWFFLGLSTPMQPTNATNEFLWLLGGFLPLLPHLQPSPWPPTSPDDLLVVWGAWGAMHLKPQVFFYFSILYILLTIIYSKLHVWMPAPRPLNTHFWEWWIFLLSLFYY